VAVGREAQAGLVLINNEGGSIQHYANGLGLGYRLGERRQRAGSTFHMQRHVRVSTAGALHRNHQRLPREAYRIMVEKQAH
jgi:hypothetical protein